MSGELDDRCAVSHDNHVGWHHEGAVGLPREYRQGLFHLPDRVDREDTQREREGRSGGLDRRQEERAACDRHLWVEQDPDPPKVGRDLLQQLEPFSPHCRFDIGEAGGVAAGPARLAANFSPTGSDTETKAIGIARVSASRALTAVVLLARSTSGFKATSSLPEAARRSLSPAAKR